MQLRRIAPIALVATVSLALSVVPAQADYSTTAHGTWVPNGTVYAIATHADRVYIAGGFSSLSDAETGVTVRRQRIAALDAETGDLITTFSATVDGRVWALDVAEDGSQIYLGGDFLTVNGEPANRLAALHPDGTRVAGWLGDANKSVRALELVGDSLYVGGRFGQVNGRNRRGLARLTASTGQIDRAWIANTSEGRVFSLAVSSDSEDLIAGGTFLAMSGEPRELLASVDLATGALTSWQPKAVCFSCTVFDLDVDDRAVYGAVGGGGGGRGVAWDPVTGQRNWIRRGDGDAQAVAVHEGTVYLGGHFGPVFDGQTRSQLVALTASTGTLLPFSIAFTGLAKPGVWALSAENDVLRVGGGFRGIQDSPLRKYAEFAYLPPTP